MAKAKRDRAYYTSYVSAYLPEELAEELAWLAARRDRPISAEIREALRHHIAALNEEVGVDTGQVANRARMPS